MKAHKFAIPCILFLLAACEGGHSTSSSLLAGVPLATPPGSAAPSVSPNMTTPPTTGGGSNSECTDTRSGFGDKAIVERICVLVNEERKKVGAPALVLDSALSNLAQAHAVDMAQRNYFSHNTPEGLTPFDRMQAAHISYQTAGENIATYYKTPEEVMQIWMNSPGHRANILKAQYGKIGVGYFQNYWVQDFTN